MLKFGSKAQTLEKLEKRLKFATVLPQIRFNAIFWNKSSLKEEIEQKGWTDFPLIVRSSTHQEDSEKGSFAGHFLSVSSVKNLDKLYEAVDRVISSYGNVSCQDEVFIQPMLERIILSGVAFSRDPNTGAPYRVINYDDTSGKADSVTSGCTNILKVYYSHCSQREKHPEPADRIIKMIEELEAYFGGCALDVEFAISSNKELFLLQVRQLIIPEKKISLHEHECLLKSVEFKYKKLSAPNKSLLGSKTVFGIMPDWNPAEIIGLRPRPLALSLYKEILTDKICAYQRRNYGYRDLSDFPLLTDFYGLPYIDVRVSFNSFIPSNTDHQLAAKLVDYYLTALKEQPHFHDKVESEIVFSSYTLDLKERLVRLREAGFSQEELNHLTQCLKALTNRIIDLEKGPFANDVNRIRRKTIEQRGSSLEITTLLEECKLEGTLPFAGIARAAFIGLQFLNSLTQMEILSPQEKDAFLSSLKGICSQIREDRKRLSKEEFLILYGHLREGTYDILSSRYDEIPDQYFNFSTDTTFLKNQRPFHINIKQKNQINNALREQRLNCDANSLFAFIKSAIEEREYSKFLFTKSLSKILQIIKKQAEDVGITPDDCSFLDVQDIKKISGNFSEAKSFLKESISRGKELHSLSKKILLPPLITSSQDIWSYCIEQSNPSYVTLGKIKAQVHVLKSAKEGIAGKIVLIPSADPGYDWIFTHPIGGLITKYGGINSHMAIRAAEVGIPAVIGAGELLYQKWSLAKVLEIDCENKRVRIPL